MRRKECIAVLKESLIPTRWMRAYISIYLIGLVVSVGLNVLSMIYALLTRSVQQQPLMVFCIIIVILGVPLLVSVAFAYKYLIDLRPSGYIWNIVHLVLSALYWMSYATLNYAIAYELGRLDYVPNVTILFLIYAGGWVLPNYLYFQKRRALFRAYTPSEIEYVMGQWHSLS